MFLDDGRGKSYAKSIPALGIIAHRGQQGHDFIAEIPLDGNLSILGRTAHSALGFQGFSQGGEVVLGAHEALHQGNLLARPLATVDCNNQALPGGREGILLNLGRSLVLKVRVRGINYPQTLFPIIIVLHIRKDNHFISYICECMDLGTLHLSADAPPAVPLTGWLDVTVHAWMVVACALLLLFLLPGIFRIFPAVSGCLTRSRGNLEIEHSLSTARARNFYSRMLVIPFIVVLDRFGLYAPSFLAGWDEPWLRFAELYLVLIAFLLLRIILHAIILNIGRKHFHSEKRLAIRRGMHNYFICFMILMAVSLGALSIFGVSDGVFRNVIRAELALFWLISITREGQILHSECGGLATILYLCGLELLPVGAVVASAVVF